MLRSMPINKKMRHKRIVILGEPEESKAAFVHMFVYGDPMPGYTIDEYHTGETIIIGMERWLLNFQNIANGLLRGIRSGESPYGHPHSYADLSLRFSCGMILLYDVTCMEGFKYITKDVYPRIWKCRTGTEVIPSKYPSGSERFGCILVGHQPSGLATDSKEVSRELAQNWADSQDIPFFELDCVTDKKSVDSAIRILVRRAIWAKKRDTEDLQDEKKLLRKRVDGAKMARPGGNKLKKRLEKLRLTG